MKQMKYLVLLFSLTLAFCKKDAEEISPITQTLTQQEQEALQCGMGFDLDDIQVFSDGVIVSNDIYIDRAQLTMPSNMPGAANDRQAATAKTKVVDYSLVSNISVFLDVNETWRPLCLQAMANWSNIAGSKVNYVETAERSQASTIIVSSDKTSFLPNGLNALRKAINQGSPNAPAGAACYPYFTTWTPAPGFPSFSGWVPGRYVLVNDVAELTPDERTRTVMHELGHTLGHGHSIVSSFGGQNDCGGTIDHFNLYGTPTDDPSSLMYPPVSGNTSFNVWDVRAAQYLYPEGTPAISSAVWQAPDETGKSADVRVNLNLNLPDFYTYTLEVYAINSEIPIDVINFTGDQKWCIIPALRLGRSYRLRLIGHNYKGDFSATASDYILNP